MEEHRECLFNHGGTTYVDSTVLCDFLRLPANWFSREFITGSSLVHARAEVSFPHGVKLSIFLCVLSKQGTRSGLDQPTQQPGNIPGNRSQLTSLLVILG